MNSVRRILHEQSNGANEPNNLKDDLLEFRMLIKFARKKKGKEKHRKKSINKQKQSADLITFPTAKARKTHVSPFLIIVMGQMSIKPHVCDVYIKVLEKN